MTTSKPTNPKDALAVGRVPFHVVPSGVIAEVALAMLEGARKYGSHNYRVKGVRSSVYYNACIGHLQSWWEGEDIDPDSGLPHVVKAIACLFVLRDAQMNSICTDDRPPPLPVDWKERLNEVAADIVRRYPNGVPPYTAVPQNQE